jgi:hypothetical protein
MMFSEGLLRARGQIVFILALAVSMVIIVGLEALSTEERIQAEVEQRLAIATADRSRAEESLRVVTASQAAFDATPGANTARDVLVALIAAVRSGGLTHADAEDRAAAVLRQVPNDALAAMPDSLKLLVEIELPGAAGLTP